MLVLVVQTTFGYAFSTFFLLPKFLIEELSSGPVGVGLVMGAFPLTATLVTPLVGVALDRRARVPLATAGCLVMVVAAAAFVSVDRVGVLAVLLRGLQGLAFALTLNSLATLVADTAPPARLGQALGLFGVAMLVTNAIAPAASEEIALRWGFAPTFWVAGGAAFVAALLTLLLHEEHPEAGSLGPAPSLVAVMREPATAAILAIAVLVGVGFSSLFSFYQPFALAIGIERVQSFLVTYAAAAVFVRVGLGHLADSLGRHRVATASLALYAVVIAGMAGLRPGLLPWLGAATGLVHGIFLPALNALALQAAERQTRGKITSLFYGGFNAGFAGGSLALGAVAQRLGYPAVFLLAAGATALGAALLARSRALFVD